MEIDFEWSPPAEKYTKAGPRWFRTAPIRDDWANEFFSFWEKKAIHLKAKGFALYKNPNNSKWYINQWTMTKSAMTESAKSPPKRPPIDTRTCLVTIPLKNKEGLKEWQIPNVEKIIASITKWGSALDGSDTGSGKTYTAIAAAREMGMKVGIICPLSVVESWKRVIKNHFKEDFVFVRNYESLRTGKYDEVVRWCKERGKKKYAHWHFSWECDKNTLLIFDESHKCKGHDTKNSKMMRAAKDQGYKILCCSATNAINPLELRATGFTLGLHKDKDFSEWLQDNGCIRGRFGFEFKGDEYILKRLNKEMLIDRGVRITREEIPDFPECDTQAISYNVGKDSELTLKVIYDDMKRELALLGKKSGNKKGDNQLVIQLRARENAEILKVPLIVDLVEDAIADGMSCAIFLNFRQSIESLMEKLNTKCVVWGDQKPEERQRNIDSFQSDKSRIIIVSVQAGGAGLSLHDLNGKHARMAFISPSFSAVDIKQVLGRIHRAGGKTKAMQRLIYCANTVEEDVCKGIQQKLKNLDLLNDGDLSPYTEQMFAKQN